MLYLIKIYEFHNHFDIFRNKQQSNSWRKLWNLKCCDIRIKLEDTTMAWDADWDVARTHNVFASVSEIANPGRCSDPLLFIRYRSVLQSKNITYSSHYNSDYPNSLHLHIFLFHSFVFCLLLYSHKIIHTRFYIFYQLLLATLYIWNLWLDR